VEKEIDWRSALLARLAHVTMPARKTASAASTRLRTPSLTKIPEIWDFTVVSLRYSSEELSALVE